MGAITPYPKQEQDTDNIETLPARQSVQTPYLERISRSCVSPIWGTQETSRRGIMTVVSSFASAADRYRVKAAELSAKALQESRSDLKAEYERLAASYLLLAAQAERNSTNDVVYEPPLQTEQVRQAQQQQQMQPKRKP